jgi:hypothetical protein
LAKACVGSSPTPRTRHKPTEFSIFEVLLHLKKKGYSESTLVGIGRKLRHLLRHVNLEDPEQVKRFISEKDWSNGYKGNVVNAYGHYLKFHGVSWEKPCYESARHNGCRLLYNLC